MCCHNKFVDNINYDTKRWDNTFLHSRSPLEVEDSPEFQLKKSLAERMREKLSQKEKVKMFT